MADITVTKSPQNDEPGGERVAATRTLDLLNHDVHLARAQLAVLQQHLSQAQDDLDAAQVVQLVEANENLMLAALHSESVAEAATSKLSDLTRSAQHDVLTDTPNRALMFDRLKNAISVAHRNHRHIAVLFLDLDDFKQINDTYGHAVGDEVVRMVAQRLESVVRQSDTVSRHGGDEFLILMAEISQPADAAIIAAKMLAALAEPHPVGDAVVRLSASIGIALYPQDGIDAPTLIARADAAMYLSKQRAPGNFEFYGAAIANEQRADATVASSDSVGHGHLALADREPQIHNLREANEQLVLAALTAQDLAAQARDARLQQTAFLATLAHELRNPLAALAAAAQLLLKSEHKPLVAAAARDALLRQVDHMARLLDDLLESSRVTHGKIQLRKERVDIAQAITAATEAVSAMIAVKRHVLTLDVPVSPLYINADRVRLAQILSNLLTNAVKYTDIGGRIHVRVLAEDDGVAIRVIDSGIGLALAALPTLFTMFSQVKSAIDRSEGGLGIGLALARNLVEMHGGTIAVSSAGLGHGSEFLVRLPLAQAPERKLPSSVGVVERKQLATRRVLVADDNHDTADSLAALLDLQGKHVRVAYDGEEAFRIAAAFQPSLLLLDIGMPKLNGYQLAKRIREQPWGAAMTLIAISGWGQEDDKRAASAAGFDFHVTKPVALEALQALTIDPDAPDNVA